MTNLRSLSGVKFKKVINIIYAIEQEWDRNFLSCVADNFSV